VAEVNVQGEIVKKLDRLSNDTMIHFLRESGQICAAASEENEDLIVPPPELAGNFTVVFDPLDGSSNIDAGVNVGTIFGIYYRASAGPGVGDAGDVQQQPRKLFAAGYAMYGAATVLVLADSDGVNGFTLGSDLLM
jgi:fructose-1,6-bisphosphatase I